MRVGSLQRALVLLILLAALCVPAIHAAKKDFEVRYEKIDNVISLNESASFALQVRNNLDIASDFLIYSGDVSWNVETDPWEERQLTVGPLKSKTVKVVVTPNQDFWPNLYGVPAKVKNVQTGEVITSELLLQITGNKSSLSGDYLPAVKSHVKVPEEIDPRDGIPLTIHLENQNNLKIEKLRIFLTSSLLNREYETGLKKLQRKDLEYLIELNPLTPPQDDRINAILEVPTDDKTYTFRAQSDPFTIIAYGGVEKDVDSSSSFLKSSTTIRLENTGNVPRDYVYRMDKHFLDGLFFKADPKPEVERAEDSRQYVWRGTLDVEGTQTIKTEMNYRWIAIVLAIALAALILYYVLRSPILITKKAYKAGTNEEGKSLVTIQLYVKNRTAGKIYDAEIKDRLPNMFTISQQFDVGTIQPKQILKHEERGTILKWNIDEIDPFEERIITYRATSRLSILGDLSLPRAVVKYKRKRIGRRYFAHSQVFSMSLER